MQAFLDTTSGLPKYHNTATMIPSSAMSILQPYMFSPAFIL
jgi:hypothetical protein